MRTHSLALPLVRSSNFVVYLKLLAVSVIWGGTFVAGRFLSADVPPLLSASIRFLLASLTLAGFLLFSRATLVRPSLRQFLHLILLGFFGIFLYNICFFYGLHYISASRASLIVALNPAAIALMSYVLLKEELPLGKILGILLCLAGAALVIVSRDASVLEGGTSAWMGDALLLGCVASWVVYSVFSRNLAQAIGPLHTVTYSIWLGSLMLGWATLVISPADLLALPSITLPQFLSLLYLGAIGSAVAYIWYYSGIQQIGATRSGAFIALNPLTAVCLGAVLLGESLTTLICIGGVLVVLGIFLCNRPYRARFGQ